jgi:hypothetical protein
MYDEQKRAFNTHVNCDEAGKKLILAAFPNMYTLALEYYLLGYAGVTVRELVQYIIHTYYSSDPTQLVYCYTKMTPRMTSRTQLSRYSRKFMMVSDTPWRRTTLWGGPICQHFIFAHPRHPENSLGM